MKKLSRHPPDDEILACLARGFDAAERLYIATEKYIQVHGALPKPTKDEGQAETPKAIAFGVAMTAIEYGLVCPEWAANAVSNAWQRFEQFEVESLGDAFEIPNHKQRAARHDELLCAAIYSNVQEARENGRRPLKDGKHGKGALQLVADKFHMSPKKIEGLCTKWKALCKATKRDPNERPKYADAEKLIAAAIFEGLKAFGTTS